MAVGFRKSLMGFNCADVMEYIEKSQRGFVERERELSEQLDGISEELNLSKEKYDKLNLEKEQMAKELADFCEKYEEIERLSENIGKLYLVAQANAQAIMANSAKNAGLARDEVQKNLSALTEAHASLDGLKKNIKKTSDDFMAEVDRLISSLNETRSVIVMNESTAAECKKQFDEVYKALVK